MKWAEFAEAATDLAELGRAAFDEQHLAILGTLRADGWPRVSPCEVYFVHGELMLGMMRSSRKARPVARSAHHRRERSGRANPEPGDFKLYGRAVEVTDARLRERYGETIHAAIGWRPDEPFPLFAVDIESAAYISFGKARRVLRWTPNHGLERLPHPDDS